MKKISVNAKKELVREWLLHKDEYATQEEFCRVHDVASSSLRGWIIEFSNVLSERPETQYDLRINLAQQLHTIAPYTIIDVHLNSGESLYHGLASASTEALIRYLSHTVGMVFVNHGTGGLNIIYKE